MVDKGMLIKKLRTALDMTQEGLSEATGYSIQTISKLENGKGADGVALNDILCYLVLMGEGLADFSSPIVPTDKVE